MPSLFRPASLPRRLPARPAALAVVVGAAALTLTACSKPTPSIGIQSGPTSVHTSATQYEFDGKVVKRSPEIPSIRAVPGGTVNIDVARSIADHGYYLSVGGQRITDTIKDDHYRLQVSNTSGQAQVVLFQAPKGGKSEASGSWVFNLKVSP